MGPDARLSSRSASHGADRNLLFGIMALQMDFISRDALIEALRDWTTQKDQPLGQILVERGDLSASRRELLEPLVDEHVRRHDNDPAASLAAISSVIDADIDWRSVADADVAASLAARRLTRNAKRSDGVSAADDGGATASADRFRVLRPHARGGIGEVFLAFDEELHREVALKEIQSRHVRDESFRERFVREAEVTGGLEHPGIVPVYSLGHYGDGRPFYAMRFIRGDSLKEAIEKFHANRSTGVSPVIVEGGKPPAEHADVNAPTVIKPEAPGGWALLPDPVAPQTPEDGQECPSSKTHISREQFASVEFRKLLGRFIDVCQAIEYAHSRGVLHRDLKPGNIMLGKYGETLVVDWGLAKAAGKGDRFADSEEATFVPSSGSGVEQTQQGSVVGTPSYMSPEQAAGKLEQLGPTADVYSLGATLHHLLTGQAPFAAQPRRPGAANAPAPQKLSVTELLRRVQHGEFPRPREIISHVPQPLEAICLKAMSLRPEDRYASSSSLAEDIEHWLADEPVTAHREAPLATASRWIRKHRAWAMSGAAALALVAVVSSVAAVWINSARDKVVTAQQAEAHQLAIALSNEKDAVAAKMKAEAAALSEKQAKEEEAKQRMLAITAAEAEKKQRLLADENSAKAIAAQKKAEAAALAEKNAKEEEAQQRMLAMTSAEAEKKQRLLAEQETMRADAKAEEARRHLYSAHMNLSQRYWENMQTGLVLDLLEKSRPRPSETDLRDFEWYYWDRLCHSAQLDLKGHTDRIVSVAFSPDGKRLASASYDLTVTVWDTTSGQETLTLKGHTGVVNSVAFSADGKQLVSASGDQTMKVWDTTSGQETLTLKGHNGGVMCVAFSADGKRLASAGGEGTVKVWDATSGLEMLTLKGHSGDVLSVAFSPNGKQLASASGDGNVKVWDATSGQETLTLKGHKSYVNSVAFSADGKRLASASEDRTVKVWDTTSDLQTLTLKGHSGDVMSVAFSPDGKRVASASSKYNIPGDVKIWDATSGQEMLTLKGHTVGVMGVTFSPDGKRLASASLDSIVKIWDATSGQEMLTLKGHTGFVFSVVFSADGKRLASAGDDRMVKVWNVTSGQESLTLKGHTSSVLGVAFSPDGKRLASASTDQTVKVWDAMSGQEMLTLNGHTSYVTSVAFSPDGKRLASASYDQMVKVWDTTSGQETVTLNGHTSYVTSVVFSPNGKRLASASHDRTVKVWDTTSGQETLTLKGHAGWVRSVAFSLDGKRLASASQDQSIKMWDARPWTPELRAEREALSLIHFLRDQGQPQSAWLDAIAADQTISELVRQRALQFACEWK